MSEMAVNVPSCSAEAASNFDSMDAAAFDPTTFTYYKENMAAWLPGAILGGVACLGFTLFLLWLFSLCCRRHYWKWELEQLPANWETDGKKRRRSKCGCLHSFLLLFFAAGVVAMSVWGLVASIQKTDTTASDFWAVVEDAHEQLGEVTGAGDRILLSLDAADAALATLAGASAAEDLVDGPLAPPVQQQVGPDSGTSGPVFIRSIELPAGDVVAAAEAARSELQEATSDARAALATVKEEGLQGIQDFIDDYKSASLKVEGTWRYVVLAVFFGLVIVAAVLTAALSLYERMPRLGATVVLLLWALTALLMLLGAGALSGARQISGDVCLYAEPWSVRQLQRELDSPLRERAVQGLRYYYGEGSIPDGDVAETLYGINLGALVAAAELLAPIREFLASEEGAAFVSQLTGGSVAARQLEALPAELDAAVEAAGQFEAAVQRDAWQPIYDSAKEYVCCDLSSSLHDLWIVWTATGCAALVLAALASARTASLVVYANRGKARMMRG